MYLGSYGSGDQVLVALNAHDPSSGSTGLSDADGDGTVRIYRVGSQSALFTLTASIYDDANTVGQYAAIFNVYPTSGFTSGAYYARAEISVASNAGAEGHMFQVLASVNVENWNKGQVTKTASDTPKVDMHTIRNSGNSALHLHALYHHFDSKQLQSATSSTVRLSSDEVASDQALRYHGLIITTGSAETHSPMQLITNYTGTTRDAVLYPGFNSALGLPTTGDQYYIFKDYNPYWLFTIGSGNNAQDFDATITAVYSRMIQALGEDNWAEPTEVPSGNATLADKIGWGHILNTNQVTQNQSIQTIYDVGGSIVATAAVSDTGSLFTRAQFT